MKLVFGFAYIGLYIVWVFYHVILKRDLKQHKTDFYGLSFLVVAWLVIYYLIFFK